MTHFTCARWRAPIDQQTADEAPVLVFQSGYVFIAGERVGQYEQSGAHLVAGLDEMTTLIVPIDHDDRDRYPAIIHRGDTALTGALIREGICQ